MGLSLRVRQYRFSVRTLLVTVAVCGVLLTAVEKGLPWLIWRYRVNRAVESAIQNGPELNWEFATPPAIIGSARRDELLYLMSDRERVFRSLLSTIEKDPEFLRRHNAARTLPQLFRQPGSHSLARQALPRILKIATNPTVPTGIAAELATLVAHRVESTGLSLEQRSAILDRARSLPPDALVGWLELLAAIGGREETLFLAALGDTDDPRLAEAIHRSSLFRTMWPGVLPHFRRWLDKSPAAEHVLKYTILCYSVEGRLMLADYACDATRPAALRKRAVEQLQVTVEGNELLLKCAESPGCADTLAESLGVDPREHLQACLLELTERNGNEFWLELIKGLRPGYWIVGPVPPEAQPQVTAMRQQLAEASLKALHVLSGQSKLHTQAEWQVWLRANRPDPVPLRSIIEVLIDHPELIDLTAIVRRLLASHLGSLPEDCVGAYVKLAHGDSPACRFWAWNSLFRHGEGADEVPFILARMSESDSEEQSALVKLLKERFAENHFSDIPAWRAWWETSHRNSASK